MFLKYIQAIYKAVTKEELDKIIKMAREDNLDKDELLVLERRVYYKLNKENNG